MRAASDATKATLASIDGLADSPADGLREIANDERGPSVTAAVVAATLLLLRDDPELGHLLDRQTLAPIERAVREVVPLLGSLLDYAPWPLLKRAAFVAEELLSPGFVAHYALRKRAVRAELLRALDEGHRQIVLVGAGFDMMSTSVPKGARVFEVDHPSTQSARRRAAGDSSENAVTFVPIDLFRSDLRDVLTRAPGFEPEAATVYVAEGLLMYLPPARVHAFLEALGGREPRSTRLVMTVITPDARGDYRLHTQRRLVDACMRGLDEPFVWGTTKEELASTLADHGFRLERVATTFELRDAELSASARRRLPRATGELLVVADGTRGNAPLL